MNVDNGNRIDAGKRFIQQDEARLHGQNARNFDTPPLAAGKRGGRAVAQPFNIQIVQQLVEFAVDLVRVFEADFQNGADVLFHRHFAENGGFLRQIADTGLRAVVDGLVHEVLAVQQNAACIGSNQAGNHVEAGGFARTVRAEQADHFAAVDIEREVFHHLPFFKGFLQAFNV